MLNLKFHSDDISEIEMLVGGITCQFFNADALAVYVQNYNEKLGGLESIKINVLYLVHHRGGDSASMKGIAAKILSQTRKESSVPIFAVTFDTRNHGSRQIDEMRNHGWNSNQSHGVDMVSCIEGTVYDLKLVMDNIGSYLDLDQYLSPLHKDLGTKIQFNNILAGYSQGGHAVIRFGNKYPESVSMINPNIGCSDLTTLLINRLKGTKEYGRKLFYCSYDELNLSDDQKSLYPQAFHEKLSAEDAQIFEQFPFERIDCFAAFYDGDPLVPPDITKSWIDMYTNTNMRTAVYHEKGVIHDISPQMIDMFIEWLSQKL